MTQPYPLTATLLTPSTRKRLPQRLRSNGLVGSDNRGLGSFRKLGFNPLLIIIDSLVLGHGIRHHNCSLGMAAFCCSEQPVSAQRHRVPLPTAGFEDHLVCSEWL